MCSGLDMQPVVTRSLLVKVSRRAPAATKRGDVGMGSITLSKAQGAPTLTEGQSQEPLAHIDSAHLYGTMPSPTQ